MTKQIIEQKYLDVLIPQGWTPERCVQLPKEYEDLGLSSIAKVIIQNFYGLEINAVSPFTGADYDTNFQDDTPHLTKEYMADHVQEMAENLGFHHSIYLLGERDDGVTFFVDDYGCFFCFNTISYEYIGGSYNALFKHMIMQDDIDSYSILATNRLCYIKSVDGVRKEIVSVYQLDPIKGLIKCDDLEETYLDE